MSLKYEPGGAGVVGAHEQQVETGRQRQEALVLLQQDHQGKDVRALAIV